MLKFGVVLLLVRVYRVVVIVDEMLESFWGVRIRFDNCMFKFFFFEEFFVEFEFFFFKIKICLINVYGRVNIVVKM